jgi:hypothetical protein
MNSPDAMPSRMTRANCAAITARYFRRTASISGSQGSAMSA